MALKRMETEDQTRRRGSMPVETIALIIVAIILFIIILAVIRSRIQGLGG